MSINQKSDLHSQSQIPKPVQEIDFEEEFCKMPDIVRSDEKFKIINHIDIDEKNMILATKAGLYLVDLKHNQLYSRKIIAEGEVWHAAFISNTHYVTYCINKTGQRQNLYLYNVKTSKLAARVKIDSEIQQIKASKSCIALSSIQEILVLHFPSLKPIYNGPAGNSVNIMFDLSYQGLTVAHNSYNRGELVIRNFTSIKRNHAITERKKSLFSSRIKPYNQKQSEGFNFQAAMTEEEEIQPNIKVKAHTDLLSQIKMSPNGSKVITASLKGTVLRVFSTKNGEKLQEFRVGYELTKILDISFVKDGNIVGCMNGKGNILLYNMSMDKQEIEYQTQRKGHKIYTQRNPKSFFSFLTFFYAPLNDSFSFNHFQLVNPEFKEESIENLDPNINKSFSKSESGFDDQKSENRENANFNHSIEELDQQHLQDLGSERKNNKSNSFKSSSSLLSRDTNQKQTEKNSYPSEKGLSQPKPLRQSLKVESSPGTKNRNTSPSRTNSLINASRITSKQKMTRSSSKKTKFSKRRGSALTSLQQEETTKKQRPFYNMVSRLYITEGNYIWAVKGYHIFGLKYDSFHGGEMVLDRTMKIQ